MKRSEFEPLFRTALDRAQVFAPALRAMLLAKSLQEVVTLDGKNITNLAAIHNNLFGINACPGFDSVEKPGNEMDKARGRNAVRYCAYPDWESSIQHALWHYFGSRHYLDLFEAMILAVERRWTDGKNPDGTWQNDPANPQHAADIVARFKRLYPIERARSDAKLKEKDAANLGGRGGAA